MPLEILIVVVFLGVGGIVAAVQFMGGKPPDEELDAQSALAEIRIDYPDFTSGLTVIDSAGNGALLVQNPGEPIAIVWIMGRNYVTRLLSGDAIKGYDVSGPVLTLKLKEFSFRKLSFLVDDAHDLDALSSAFDALVSSHKS